LTQITIAAVAGALFALPSTNAQAQPPRQMGGAQVTRARQACDVAAAQAGYRVMRRDRENVNGGSYQMPMHVSHGSTQSDITCSYDMQRNVATVPPWVAREEANNGRYAGNNYTDRATRACERSVNARRGWHAEQVGTPTQHGQRQWDVPVTVRRNGRGDETVTCRYNAANGKASIRG
jgi:hypothetical protein